MRVFITGASGFVGRAMIAWSLDHGDSVVALARSDKSSDAAFGAANGRHIQVLRGDIGDPEVLAKGEWPQQFWQVLSLPAHGFFGRCTRSYI